jgi:organic radical activating enzyme
MDNVSNLKEQLKEIDDRIAELEKDIELGKALERLHENEDFKKVILEGYLEDEAERLFELMTTPMKFKREIMENIQEKLGSIRNLKEFFAVKLQNAGFAKDQIEEEKEYRKDVTEANSQEMKLIEGEIDE